MAEGITFENAVTALKQKYISAPPNTASSSVFVPSEQYRSLYEPLEIIGTEREDIATQTSVKYIWDALKEQGNPQELIIDILTQLAVPIWETKLSQVEKYLRLNRKSSQLLKYYNLTQEELKVMKKAEVR